MNSSGFNGIKGKVSDKLKAPKCICDGCGSLTTRLIEGDYHSKRVDIKNTVKYGRYQRVITYKRDDVCGTWQKIVKLGPIKHAGY